MKRKLSEIRRLAACFLITGFLLLNKKASAQQEELTISMQEEMRLELQASENENEIDDDSYLLQMQEFKRHPLSVNTADENQLRELRIITDLQIQQLLIYRSIFGAFISIYELQAVPGWDVETLRKIKPFISLRDDAGTRKSILQRLHGGETNFMLRSSFVPEVVAGFKLDDSGTSKYAGSRSRLFARLQYNYKNLLQFGVLADKDAGEQLFKGARKNGFDFYSWHLFARKAGSVQALAVGDYTVSLGQGLIHWQSNGLRKNAEVMMVKRQGEILRPYRSAGEYNFMRGIGITFKYKRIFLTPFISYRKFSASTDADSNGVAFTSINTSGYHRTVTEIAKRNNLTAIATGGSVKYFHSKGSVAVNTIHYFFSLPAKVQDKPYDLYGPVGKHLGNYSVDYSYTFRNLHLYGEAAVDQDGHPAFVNGLLASIDPRLDVSMVYRNLHKGYQSFAGNTFTENSVPSNEKGLYAGISLRPSNNWILNLYSDFFVSPWLRFKTDAPSRGRGYLFQVIHRPSKKTELYTRYSNEQKMVNTPGAASVLPEIMLISKKEWRLQFSTQMTKELLFRSRISMSWYGEMGKALPQKGFLGYTDVSWKPSGIISGNARLQYFDMDDYNTRIYAYESGPLYDMSIPALFDAGWRYYINARLQCGKLPLNLLPGFQTDLWLRWAQTVKTGLSSTGSGNDLLLGPLKSEIRIQVMLSNK